MEKNTLIELRNALIADKQHQTDKKKELIRLVDQLLSEIDQPSRQQQTEKDSRTLRETISELETEYPDFVEMTNRACKMLADIGI